MTSKKNKIIIDNSQPIFVGMDIHKNKWSICIIHQDEVIKKATLPGEFHSLEKLLEKYKDAKIYSVYEAGFSGFHLHYKLTAIKIENIIVSPNKIPIESGNLVKTDRRDAYKLALYLSKGLFIGIHIPTEQDINIRQIMRTREAYKIKRNRCINQIKMLLIQHGIKMSKGLTKTSRSNLRNMKLPKYVQMSIDIQLEELEFHEKKISELEKLAKKECDDLTYEKNYKILNTVPGIGKVIAASLCFEIGDWSRFRSGKELASWLGLTPREFSSGENIRKGHITGQGCPWLRSYLVEASWIAIRKDEAIKKYYNRVKFNSGSGKKAIVAVTRKMMHRVLSIIKNNQCYSLGTV